MFSKTRIMLNMRIRMMLMMIVIGGALKNNCFGFFFPNQRLQTCGWAQHMLCILHIWTHCICPEPNSDVKIHPKVYPFNYPA